MAEKLGVSGLVDLVKTPVLEPAVESGFSDPPVLLVSMSSRKGKDLRDIMLLSDSACCKMPVTPGWEVHTDDGYSRQYSASTADTSYSRQYSCETDSDSSSLIIMPTSKDDDLKDLTQVFKQLSDPPFQLEEWDLLEESIGEGLEVSDAGLSGKDIEVSDAGLSARGDRSSISFSNLEGEKSPNQDEEPLRTILDYAQHLYKQKHGYEMPAVHGAATKPHCSDQLQAINSSRPDNSPIRNFDSSRKELDRVHALKQTPELNQGNNDKPQVLLFRPRPSPIEIPQTPGHLRRFHRTEVIVDSGELPRRHRWQACFDACSMQ